MLNEKQIQLLLDLARSTTPDSMDCDHCFGEIAKFAELELAGRSLPDAMERVRVHLTNCPCCKDEYEMLLEALRGMQSGENTPDAVP